MAAEIISDLLQHEPLYRKKQIEKTFYHPQSFSNLTFQFHCMMESDIRTFKLILAPDKLIQTIGWRDYAELFKPFKSDTEVEFVQAYIGRCQSCNKYEVHFLLHTFSEGEIQRALLEPTFMGLSTPESEAYKKSLTDAGKLYVRKVGQWPGHQLKADKVLYSFLDDEDKYYYDKALLCLSHNHGVGAFAYLRKIVEKEIIRMVEELATNSTGETDKIKALLQEFHSKKQMSNLLDSIFPFLPNDLKSLGFNPFKILYGKLSEGVHHLSDEECLTIASSINDLLIVTIKRLRQDQIEQKRIQEALKHLK